MPFKVNGSYELAPLISLLSFLALKLRYLVNDNPLHRAYATDFIRDGLRVSQYRIIVCNLASQNIGNFKHTSGNSQTGESLDQLKMLQSLLFFDPFFF